MPKEAIKLSKTIVESLVEPGDYRDKEIKGFICRVRQGKSGKTTRTYLYVGKMRGSQKNHSITIGVHGDITNKEARDKAEEIRSQLKKEVNPTGERRERQAAETQAEEAMKAERIKRELTLSQLLDDYIQVKKLKPKTQSDYIRFTNRCLSDWLQKPVLEITRDMVEARHRALSVEHPAQANYTMRILRALFTFAGYRYEVEGRSMVESNPVRVLSQLKTWNRVKRRQTVIEPHELGDWLKAVDRIENKNAADLFRLVLFTGLRDNEAKSLHWTNVDFKAGTIRIEDTKNHDTHVLPMSSYLHKLLKRRYNERTNIQWVFPGAGSASGHIIDVRDSIKHVTEICGKKFTVQDLRRTFETIAEGMDLSRYTLKKLLNHKMTGDVTAGYIVLTVDRLRDAMQRITDRILEIAEITEEEEAPAKVVKFKGRSR